MKAADAQLQQLLATTSGVLLDAEEPKPQLMPATGTSLEVVEEARPVHVPEEFAAYCNAGDASLEWTREALAVQVKHRDDANAERTTAWNSKRAAIEASEPMAKQKPRVYGPSEEGNAIDAASARLKAKLTEARRQFDIDWPAPPQPSLYLSAALSTQIRQKHERVQIAKTLGPALEKWEQSVEAWEQAVKDGLSKRKAREVEERKAEVRRQIEAAEKLEQAREEARSFKMLDANGKLRQLP